VHVLRAEGVRSVDLDCQALERAAWQARPFVVVDDPAAHVEVRYRCGGL
jgi:hypothetical protein